MLARNYAERARAAYEELADRVHVGQLTNNLGGLNFLLGKTDEAIDLLKEAFGIALETGRDADAGAGRVLARADPSPHRQRRAGRGAGAARARSSSSGRRRGLHRRGRQRAARARPRAARAGPPRRGRGGVRRGRGQLRPARLRPAIARPPGSRAAISRRGAATTGLQHTSTAPRQRHSRTSGSNGGKEVIDVTKARFISLADLRCRSSRTMLAAVSKPSRVIDGATTAAAFLLRPGAAGSRPSASAFPARPTVA